MASSNSTFKITSGTPRDEEYNLMRNPGIELGTGSSWVGDITGGGVGIVNSCSDPDYVYSGRFSMRVLADTGTDGVRTYLSDYAPTVEPYTLSWKVKWGGSDTPATGAAGVLLGAVSLTPVNYRAIDRGWYQYWVTFDGVSGGEKLHFTQANATVSFMDEIRLCLGTYTEYFDGDSFDASWDGSPGNSSSTRRAKEAAEFEFANIDNRDSGFFLNGVVPNVAQYRGGGAYNQSVFGDGRTLVDTKYDNVIETINLMVLASSQDDIAQMMQDMRRLLIKAKDYWINKFSTDPVWIEARSSTETNIRYGIIHNAQIVSDVDMWRQPFLQPKGAAFMGNIQLIIERGHWQDEKPGNRSYIDISNEVDYDTNGLTYGMEASREAFILNGRQTANITHIFKWDESLSSFSTNMVNEALPWDMFDLPYTTDDAIYFGIESTGEVDAAQPCNLVFDIGDPARMHESGFDLEQYYSGAWADALVQYDGTAESATGKPMRRNGPGMVTFYMTQLTVPHAINGVTGYWVRYRLTYAQPAQDSPSQQNRLVYTATQPYVEVSADEIGGDIDAPAKISVFPTYKGINKVICAARSVSRGSDFTPVINLSQTNNPTGVTVTVPGALTTFATEDITACASNDHAFYEIPAAGPAARLEQVKVVIASPLAWQYSGRFRLMVRFWAWARDVVGGIWVDADFTVDAEVSSGSGGLAAGQPSRFDYDNTALHGTYFVSDLGVFDLSQIEGVDEISISIYVSSVGGYFRMYFSDLWLMPVDEFYVESDDVSSTYPGTASEAPLRGKLVIDGTQIKRGIESYAMDGSEVVARYNTNSSSRPFIKPNTNVRLYFLTHYTGNYYVRESQWNLTSSVAIEKVQRYLSMRGSR